MDFDNCLLPKSRCGTFLSPQKDPSCPFAVRLPSLTPAGDHRSDVRQHSLIVFVPELPVSGVALSAVLCLAAFPLCDGFEIHPSCYTHRQFVLPPPFFCPELNSSEWLYYGLPVHCLVDDHHLGCFQGFAAMNQATMNTGSFTSLFMDAGAAGS